MNKYKELQELKKQKAELDEKIELLEEEVYEGKKAPKKKKSKMYEAGKRLGDRCEEFGRKLMSF